MHKTMLCVVLFVFGIAGVGVAQSTDERDIDRLFQDLRQTLIKRSAPDSLLVPTDTFSQRIEEAQKAMRPYVGLQFKYNLADLQRKTQNTATLPLIIQWETARSSGRLESTAHLEEVDGRWYFRDFEFMQFPWAIVIGGCSLGLVFTVVALYFYRRSQTRWQHTPA